MTNEFAEDKVENYSDSFLVALSHSETKLGTLLAMSAIDWFLSNCSEDKSLIITDFPSKLNLTEVSEGRNVRMSRKKTDKRHQRGVVDCLRGFYEKYVLFVNHLYTNFSDHQGTKNRFQLPVLPEAT